ATEPPQGTEPGTERDNATHTATAATAYAKAGTSTATATAATATAATAYAAAGTSTLATQGKPNDAAATQATSSEGAGESAGESAGATTRDGTEAYRVESAEEGEEIICARGAHLPEWQLRQTFSAAPTDSSEIGKAKGLDKDGNLLLR
ncbi:MAG: hypothetical protein K8963_01270, partial [Proteobacteria bacterium]|nr:hypothetical protein [Pseudomonadota bacterium]